MAKFKGNRQDLEKEEETDENESESEEVEKSEDEDAVDSSDEESSSSDEEADEDGHVDALFKGSAIQGEEEGDSEDDSVDDDAENVLPTSMNKGTDECTFDLRNMTALNSHQIMSSSLYSKKASKDSNLTIALEDEAVQVDEAFLLKEASAGCKQLISTIWQLPTESSDAGPLATLPAYEEVRIPRALPPPAPKEETKWEKFAKAKGIPLNKEKRSRKVWDEATGTWMFRHGYEKANSTSKEWPIMEVGANDDPFEDPWEKVRDAKRSRTEKNLENRMKNQERVGNLAKGTTNRVLKGREKSRSAGKAGGNMDRDTVLPTGVPVDLKSDSGDVKLRGKASTSAALQAVQRSTASLGKFDKMREGEPERKKTLSKVKKRKFESPTDKKVITSEGEKSMKILGAVLNGGGVAKQKAIRKGQFAKGETAYDYEYNDGLDASSFKKKKGRAGAGKMKKMTKKRVI